MSSKGEPLSGVRVTLRRGETSNTVETDPAGVYCFCRVAPARDYSLLVEREGFARVIQNDLSVAGRKLAILNLILRPTAGFMPSSGKGDGSD